MRTGFTLFGLTALCGVHGAASAQDALDRGDPAIVEEEFGLSVPLDDPSDVDLPDSPAGQSPIVDAEGGVLVGAVRVLGSSLPPEAFVDAITPYLGRTLGPEQLQRLSTEIAHVLQDRGFVFATAWIAPQRLDSGMLRVSVDEGTVAEVRYQGAANSAVEAVLDPLASGVPVTRSQLERRLLLAGDIPGVTINDPQYLRENGQGVLQVTVTEDGARGWAQINNNGNESIGPWRAQAGAQIRSVIGDGDQLTVSAAATPFEPGDFILGSMRYQFPIGGGGTVAAIDGYYARSEPDSIVPNRRLEGDSFGLYAGVSHPLIRGRNASLWGWIGGRYRQSMQDDSDVAIRDDRITTAELGLNGFVRVLGGRWNGGGRIVQGIGIFDATQEGDPLASRFDGDGVFTKFEAWGNWYRSLGGNFAVELAGMVQAATRPLLASEEMGIGGPRYGRGFDWYERSGENGLAGSIEVQYDFGQIANGIPNVQLYAFADGAGVRNLEDGGGGGRLASAGGGTRIRLGDNVSVGAEAGVPLNEDRFDSGDRSPRVRLVVGADF